MLKFNENATNHHDQRKRCFLRKAIQIAEQYINTDELKKIFTSYFFVPLNSFKENLSDVTIDFKEPPSGKLPSNSSIPLSWVYKPEKHKININEIFWKRCLVSTISEQEVQVITVAVAMFILHELAHLGIQWTESKEYIKAFL